MSMVRTAIRNVTHVNFTTVIEKVCEQVHYRELLVNAVAIALKAFSHTNVPVKCHEYALSRYLQY